MTLTYEELANTLEEGWAQIGLHEHEIAETINPTTLERALRAQLFPEHGEPLTELNTPPWVELTLVWDPAHQLHSGPVVQLPLELLWEYTITIPPADRRSDSELVRAAHTAIAGAFRRVFHQDVGHEVLALDVRRSYKLPDAKELRSIELHARGNSDISEVLTGMGHEHMQTVVREEFAMVNVLLQAFADVFNPGSVGGYRTVESA